MASTPGRHGHASGLARAHLRAAIVAARGRSSVRHFRARPWVVAVLVAVLTGACASISDTALEWGYEHADWLLTRKIDDYVSLDAAQSRALAQQLDTVGRWHRSHELTRYADLLERTAEHLGGRLHEPQLQAAADDVRQRWEALAQRLVVDLTPLLGTLDPAQRADIAQRFARDNERFHRALVGPGSDRAVRVRTEELVEHIERWTGHLTRQQRAIVQTLPARTPELPEIRLAERRRLQQRFSEALASGPDGARAATALFDLICAPFISREPVYRTAVSRYHTEFVAMLLRLDASLTVAQRETAVERMRRVARLLRRLAADPVPNVRSGPASAAAPPVSLAETARADRPVFPDRSRGSGPDRRSGAAASRAP